MSFVKWILGEAPGPIETISYIIKNKGTNTGDYGEYLTEYMFGNNNLQGYSKTLRNIYLPHKNGTTEIDILLVHEKGIFIIESKNYSGWIFGSENNRYWTQSLINKEKHKFYNPILQNKTHITALSNYLKIHPSFMKSYIVFSERCELKKIPNCTNEYTILKRDVLLKSLRNELNYRPQMFNQMQIDWIINRLTPFTNVSQDVKQQHINNIQNKIK